MVTALDLTRSYDFVNLYAYWYTIFVG